MFKNWEKVNLTLDTNPENYFQNTKLFFETLENDYKIFIKEKEDKKRARPNWEGCEINSPISILDGRWGSGKTFFIENLLDNFEKHKNESEIKLINEYQILDALDIVESEDVIYGFLAELLKSKMDKKSKSINIAKELGKFSLNFIIDAVNNLPGFDIEKLNDQEIIKKIETTSALHNDGATLIIIDNIERLGSDVDKVLKLIYKLRKVNGLIFLLVTNVNAIDSNSKKEKSEVEFPIYKFVNLTTYNFSQNYEPIINKLNLNGVEITDEEIEIINKSFNNEQDIQQLTIRQFESWLNTTEYLYKDKMLDRYRLISDLGIDVKGIFSDAYNTNIGNLYDLVKKISLKRFEFLNISNNQFMKEYDLSSFKLDENGYYRPLDNPKAFLSDDGKFTVYEKAQNGYQNNVDTYLYSKWIVNGEQKNFDYMKKISLCSSDIEKSLIKSIGLQLESKITIDKIHESISNYQFDLFDINKFKDETKKLNILFKNVYEEIENEHLKITKSISDCDSKLNRLEEEFETLSKIKDSSDEHIAFVNKLKEVNESLEKISKLDDAYAQKSHYKHELEKEINENLKNGLFDENADENLNKNIENKSVLLNEIENKKKKLGKLSLFKNNVELEKIENILSEILEIANEISSRTKEELLDSTKSFIINDVDDFEEWRKKYVDILI